MQRVARVTRRTQGDALRRTLAIGALLAAAAAPNAFAQFKIVGPDGRVTYTDIPPAGAVGSIRQIEQRSLLNGPAQPELPQDLQQIIARNPVTLYVVESKCDPCVAARNFLRNRGIPFAERLVKSEDDIRIFRQRVSPDGTVPVVTVGAKKFAGFEAVSWAEALETAGYPSENKLPPGYQPPAAQGLAPTPVSAAPENLPVEPPAPIPTEAPPSVNGPPGFRF